MTMANWFFNLSGVSEGLKNVGTVIVATVRYHLWCSCNRVMHVCSSRSSADFSSNEMIMRPASKR